jgi:hypothetical protein
MINGLLIVAEGAFFASSPVPFGEIILWRDYPVQDSFSCFVTFFMFFIQRSFSMEIGFCKFGRDDLRLARDVL